MDIRDVVAQMWAVGGCSRGQGLPRGREAAAPGTGAETLLQPEKILHQNRGKMGVGRSSRKEQL